MTVFVIGVQINVVMYRLFDRRIGLFKLPKRN